MSLDLLLHPHGGARDEKLVHGPLDRVEYPHSRDLLVVVFPNDGDGMGHRTSS
jgi:hypothetical protein